MYAMLVCLILLSSRLHSNLSSTAITVIPANTWNGLASLNTM